MVAVSPGQLRGNRIFLSFLLVELLWETHVKINPLQTNMRCRCCCRFMQCANNTITLFGKRPLNENIKVPMHTSGGIVVKDEDV